MQTAAQTWLVYTATCPSASHQTTKVPKFKTFGRFDYYRNIKGLEFSEDMTEIPPQTGPLTSYEGAACKAARTASGLPAMALR